VLPVAKKHTNPETFLHIQGEIPENKASSISSGASSKARYLGHVSGTVLVSGLLHFLFSFL